MSQIAKWEQAEKGQVRWRKMPDGSERLEQARVDPTDGDFKWLPVPTVGKPED